MGPNKKDQHKNCESGNFLIKPCFEELEYCVDIVRAFYTDIIFTLTMIFQLQKQFLVLTIYCISSSVCCFWNIPEVLCIPGDKHRSFQAISNGCEEHSCLRGVHLKSLKYLFSSFGFIFFILINIFIWQSLGKSSAF